MSVEIGKAAPKFEMPTDEQVANALSNEKFAAATELLFLSLDFRTRYNIAQNYSVGV